MKIKYLWVLFISFYSTGLLALEEEPESAWKGEAELGYIFTSGNSNSETLNLKTKLSHESEKWKNIANVSAIRVADNNIVTANRYFASVQSNYNLNKISYLFGLLSHDDDEFSGYDYQTSLVFGYGHKIINNAKVKMDAEVGVGGRTNKLDTGVINNETLSLAGLSLTWKMSKFAVFEEKVTFEGSDSSDTIKSATSLKTKINSQLASKITYSYKHVSAVPAGVYKEDKEIAVTLVYSY